MEARVQSTTNKAGEECSTIIQKTSHESLHRYLHRAVSFDRTVQQKELYTAGLNTFSSTEFEEWARS